MEPASIPSFPSTETVPACTRVPLERTIRTDPSASCTRRSALSAGFTPRALARVSERAPGANKTFPSPIELSREKWTRSRPSRFSVARSPEASTTLPPLATIKPSFNTAGPVRTAYPPSDIVIRPWLTTAPRLPLESSKNR